MRNESLVVEVQGYEVQDPVVTIEYQQTHSKADEPINPAIFIIFSDSFLGSWINFFLL